MTLRDAVGAFLAKVDTGWAIDASHIDPLRNAATEDALKQETARFLAKADTGWAIHASHLEPMRAALKTLQQP